MKEAQALRQQLREARGDQADDAPPLQRRFFQVAQNLTADLILALEANRALHMSHEVQLRPQGLKPYRDLQIAAAVGLRSALVFALAAGLWVGTASPMAIMLMIMPVMFTILFARLPEPDQVLKRATFSSVLATPVALFFTLPLLAINNGNFPLLILILGAPLFIGLLAISKRLTLPLGLGFCTPYIILVQPGNAMDFDVARVASNGLAISTGIAIAFLMFRLITPPNGPNLRRRLIRQTAADLTLLGVPSHASGGNANVNEEWFNARMADRLRWLTICDKALPEAHRHFTDLGLTGLNLGQVSLWIQSRLRSNAPASLVDSANRWQLALSAAYQACSQGKVDEGFRQQSEKLKLDMEDAGNLAQRDRELIAGALERIALTFERMAYRLAQTQQNRGVTA